MLIYLPMITWAGMLQIIQEDRKARARLQPAKCPAQDKRRRASR